MKERKEEKVKEGEEGCVDNKKEVDILLLSLILRMYYKILKKKSGKMKYPYRYF